MNGFYLTLGKRDMFFVTERKRKDKGTLNAILDKLKILPTEDRRRELDYWLSKATAEVFCFHLVPGLIVINEYLTPVTIFIGVGDSGDGSGGFHISGLLNHTT